MSNEQVVLEMVINRLRLLLEAHEELKAKWSAEITEIILLGKGVLIATPENKTTDGKWLLSLSDEELDMLSNMFWQDSLHQGDFDRGLTQLFGERIGLLFEIMAGEAQDETYDDPDADDDDPIEDEPMAAPAAPQPLLEVDLVDHTHPVQFVRDIFGSWRAVEDPHE
jgi:hypothetical protein